MNFTNFIYEVHSLTMAGRLTNQGTRLSGVSVQACVASFQCHKENRRRAGGDEEYERKEKNKNVGKTLKHLINYKYMMWESIRNWMK